ncbi:MAG: hypothetical protein WBD37_04145, partial [Anderseniella sp.]
MTVVFGRLAAFLCIIMICLIGAHETSPAMADIRLAQSDTAQTEKVKPGQLLLQRRNNANNTDSNVSFVSSPIEWIKQKQRDFYTKMSKALGDIKRGSSWTAALTLLSLSFAYGVLHAAGPGHGKAVVSAWMLANERQLRRGIIISFLAALIQAITAIVLVSVLLLTVDAAARTAKSMAQGLEAASYFLIALTGA